MSQLPELSNYEGDIRCVEAEHPSSVVVVHTTNQALDALLRNLCHSDTLQIKHTCPTLNLAGHHRMADDIVEEEVSHGDQSVQLDAGVKHSPYIDEENRVHLDVAFVTIKNSKLEIILELACIRDYKLLLPFRMFNDLIVSLLVVPLETLQEAEDNTVCVIIARGQF